MAKTCFQHYTKILNLTKLIAAICGANVLKADYKVNIHPIAVIIVIKIYLAFSFYTIYVGVVVDGDWKVILQSLSLAGSAVQGYSKILSAIFKKDGFRYIHRIMESIYMEYEADNECLPVLRYRIGLTAKMLKIVACIYVFTTVGITVYPLVYGPLHGQRLLVMQFLLPGIDHTTDSGYWLYVVSHSFCMYLGAFGNFAGDIFVFISITHVPLLKDILKIKCEKLNRVALRTKNPKETMPMLKDIAQFHQGYIKFVQQAEKSYYFIIFTQVFTSVMSICCTLFSILIKSWPAAFIYLIYSSIMLFTFCALGNLVEMANDDIIEMIYGDILFYELSIPEQKLVLLMLRKSQKPITLTVGHIMPLSMNTALQLTKAIYSYMMMLVNFLETVDM